MIRRPPRSTHCISSAASDVYKRQVRTWSEGDEIARVKEVMVGVDARIEAAFSVEAAAKFRRWAAGVLLDVFGSSDDLADTIMTPQQRPKFRDASPSLTQFERFEHYDDLWEGEDSRADELSEWIERKATLGDTDIDDAPAVLTRWVVAISIAELVHICLLYTSPSPRDATLSRMPSSA